MAIKNKIKLIAILLTTFTVFSKGQSSLGTVCAESREVYGVSGFSDSEFIWSVEGGVVVNGDGADTITLQWGYETGDYRMEVVEITSTNCTGVPSLASVNVQAPEVDLGYDFFEICDKDSMVFDATGAYVGNFAIQWQDSSIASTYTAKQTEVILVKVTDGDGCVRYDSVDFIAHPLPQVYIGEDTVLCDVENPLELIAADVNGSDYASYEWYSASRDGLVSISPNLYLGPGKDTVRVNIEDYNGCVDSDTLVILACSIMEMFKDMRNSFTPNDDGANDTWNITNFMHLFPDAVIEIFDRWGRLVYRSESVFEEPWDGTSNGREMPMDSYFFVLELNYMNLEALSGTINLIR